MNLITHEHRLSGFSSVTNEVISKHPIHILHNITFLADGFNTVKKFAPFKFSRESVNNLTAFSKWLISDSFYTRIVFYVRLSESLKSTRHCVGA